MQRTDRSRSSTDGSRSSGLARFDHYSHRNGSAGESENGVSRRVKPGWVTRRIPAGYEVQWRPVAGPKAGDVLLCEIVKVSLHSRLETRTGQRSGLYEGDLVICAVGARYATSMLEGVAEIHGDLGDLLSASGVCGSVLERSEKRLPATSLRVIAQAFDSGRPLNLRSFGLEGAPSRVVREPLWALVLGSAMDSGKTTACTALIHALSQAGLRVGAVKLTGTASARDWGAYRDAGAEPVLDFLDCGWESTTGCSTLELERIARALAAELRGAALDVAVVEVADGITQPETRALLEDLRRRLNDPTVIFTAGESLAAVAGVERLRRMGYGVRAVSGVVTNSPLRVREVELEAGLPCVRTRDLGRRALEFGWFSGEPAGPRAVTATA
jgi:hypothetical protein